MSSGPRRGSFISEADQSTRALAVDSRGNASRRHIARRSPIHDSVMLVVEIRREVAAKPAENSARLQCAELSMSPSPGETAATHAVSASRAARNGQISAGFSLPVAGRTKWEPTLPRPTAPMLDRGSRCPPTRRDIEPRRHATLVLERPEQSGCTSIALTTSRMALPASVPTSPFEPTPLQHCATQMGRRPAPGSRT